MDLPIVPITGELSFDYYFSVVFWIGLFGWSLGALLRPIRRS